MDQIEKDIANERKQFVKEALQWNERSEIKYKYTYTFLNSP